MRVSYCKYAWRACCREIVAKIDKDKDSFVTEQELVAWIKYIQKTYVTDDAKSQWANYDKSDKDSLSWAEFAKHTYGDHTSGETCGTVLSAFVGVGDVCTHESI